MNIMLSSSWHQTNTANNREDPCTALSFACQLVFAHRRSQAHGEHMTILDNIYIYVDIDMCVHMCMWLYVCVCICREREKTIKHIHQ